VKETVMTAVLHTGQNPASSAQLARNLIDALNRG
jgi:hypothetical protein